MSTRVIVLGGDGMLGRMIRLHLAGVAGLTVDWTSRREARGALAFDAGSPRSLVDLARDRGGYDYAINCIAVLKNEAELSGPEGAAAANQINAVFPHELARTAAEIDCKVIHVSTDAVFAPDSGTCLESNVPHPVDLYGRTKLQGEPAGSNVITLRCSIIGPNPVKKTGLLEWMLGQPSGAMVSGYDDQVWSGVTTLQFAQLCGRIFQEDLFRPLRDQSAVHHFAPNAALTKFELLELVARRFRPDVRVQRARGGSTNRVLQTEGMLRDICGAERPMAIAIDELSTYIDGPKPGRA